MVANAYTKNANRRAFSLPQLFSLFPLPPCLSLLQSLTYLHDGGEQPFVDPRDLLLGDDGLDAVEETVVLVGATELREGGRERRKEGDKKSKQGSEKVCAVVIYDKTKEKDGIRQAYAQSRSSQHEKHRAQTPTPFTLKRT